MLLVEFMPTLAKATVDHAYTEIYLKITEAISRRDYDVRDKSKRIVEILGWRRFLECKKGEL